MRVLIRFLKEIISKTEKEISDDIQFRTELDYGCLSHKWTCSRIKKNQRFLAQLNDAINILNGETVKRGNVCFKCQGTGQIPYFNFAGSVAGSNPCDCQLKSNMSESN